jgi:hypothetical protein
MYTMEQMQTMAEVAAKAAVAHMTQAFQTQAEAQRPTSPPTPSPTQPGALPCDEDLIHEIDEMPVATFSDEACGPIAVGSANVIALNRIARGHLGADNPKAVRILQGHR